MTGPEHYREAERDIQCANGESIADGFAQFLIARAQVHATLALAAAAEASKGFHLTDSDVMRCAHGAAVCGLCGYGMPAGDGGRS